MEGENIKSIAKVAIKSLSIEKQTNIIDGSPMINITKINNPGTIIWIDPTTNEERYTAPGEKMYGTALMFATHFINKFGKKEEF